VIRSFYHCKKVENWTWPGSDLRHPLLKNDTVGRFGQGFERFPTLPDPLFQK
jgi:hypothetical protein